MKSKEECKKILSKIGFRLGIAPRLISERLLSQKDKVDLMEGSISIVDLEKAVEVWKHNGLCDYAHGLTIPMRLEK